ncbi:hypothetical protein D3C80_1668190 [compost metagenome]
MLLARGQEIQVIVKQRTGNAVIPTGRRIPILRTVFKIGLWHAELQGRRRQVALNRQSWDALQIDTLPIIFPDNVLEHAVSQAK